MPKYEVTARRTQLYMRVLSEIRQLPGVTSAGYMSFLPMTRMGGIWPVTIAGQPKNIDRAFHQAALRYITPGYLEAMRMPLLRGRATSESDTSNSQSVAVVSDSFVRQYWPGQDPIGRQFDFAFSTWTVMGVAGDVRFRGLESPSEPQVYLPYKQVADGSLVWYAPKDLVIRSTIPTEHLAPIVRRIVAAADPELPISDVQMLTQIVEDATAARLIQVRALAGFALIAILMAGIGIHGLLSFAVSNRSQEIGVRIAVGAQAMDILTMVLRESVLLALAGIAVGAVLSYAVGRALESLLAGVQPGDFDTYATGFALAGGMTLAGSFWPALRALRIDPITAVRAE